MMMKLQQYVMIRKLHFLSVGNERRLVQQTFLMAENIGMKRSVS